MAVDSTNAALQIFGGAGYIEDTGVAQLVRDARITTIYREPPPYKRTIWCIAR